MCDLSSIKTYDELPVETKNYIEEIEKLIDCPIDIISVGANREQTIIKKNPFKK